MDFGISFYFFLLHFLALAFQKKKGNNKITKHQKEDEEEEILLHQGFNIIYEQNVISILHFIFGACKY